MSALIGMSVSIRTRCPAASVTRYMSTSVPDDSVSLREVPMAIARASAIWSSPSATTPSGERLINRRASTDSAAARS